MSLSYLLHICWFFFFHFQFVNCFWLFESEFTLPAYIHTYNFDDLSINSSHLKISKYLQVNKLFHIDVLNILMGFLHPGSIFQYNHDLFSFICTWQKIELIEYNSVVMCWRRLLKLQFWYGTQRIKIAALLHFNSSQHTKKTSKVLCLVFCWFCSLINCSFNISQFLGTLLAWYNRILLINDNNLIPKI